MKPFPEHYELIGFFEVEPQVLDPGVPWVYNRLTFTATRGDDQVVCDIAPSNREIVVSWNRGGFSIGRFVLNEVVSLALTSLKGEEFMTAKFQHAGLSEFRLYLKPRVQVQWGNAGASYDV